MEYQEIMQLIAKGAKYEYESYDHKSALKEYNSSEKWADYKKTFKKPNCHDLPQELKEKYITKKIGKLRRIDFNPQGKAWRFKIGHRYSKTFYLDDFGTKLKPILN